jgi:hypothetical protein
MTQRLQLVQERLRLSLDKHLNFDKPIVQYKENFIQELHKCISLTA